MAKRGPPSKRRIARSAVKEDLISFVVPAILLFFGGLSISAKDGWVEFPATLWNLIRHPGSISALSFWNILGLILIVAGFAILLLAQITLGRYHASVPLIWEDHQLIRHGVYRLVRHPLYLGVITISIGLAVYGPSLPGVLIMSLLIPVFLVRIRIEERLLVEKFGDVYREYQRTTRQLFPFVF